jgi:hypothetical protein
VAVRKAAALIEQLAERGMSLDGLTPDELACYADVMDAAVAATSKLIELPRPRISDSGRADEAQATV